MWLLPLILLSTTVSDAAIVPDDYPTLAEAVANTPPGGVIEVRPGRWAGDLYISTAVEIRGLGHAVDTVIEGVTSAPLILAPGASVSLRNLTLDGMGFERGIWLGQNASVDMRDARCVRGSRLGADQWGGCIRVSAGAELYAERVWFEDSEAFGGAFLDVAGGHATVVDSLFVGGRAEHGAAIVVWNGTLDLVNTKFGDNQATENGGAVLVLEGASASIDASRFHGNSAVGYGGAVYVQSGSLTARDSVFSENVAGVDGGAVSFMEAQGATLERAVLVGNQATWRGGGLAAELTAVEMVHSWVQGNTVTSGEGAGLYAAGGSLELGQTLVRDNVSPGSAGGTLLWFANGSVSDGNLYCGNVAGGPGGGLAIRHSTGVTMANTVFLFNGAEVGGGVHVESGTATMYESVLLANDVAHGGAHVHVQGAGSSDQVGVTYSLLAWGQGGPGFMALGGYAYSDQLWYHANPLGNSAGLSIEFPGYSGDPGLLGFSPAVPDCSADVRPISPLPVGPPWTGSEAPRWYLDEDGDGQPGIVDCNDADPNLHPDTVWFRDADRDGYGTDSQTFVGCVPPGADWVLQGGDCDDADVHAHPEAIWYADADGDGYGDADSATVQCARPPATSHLSGDCDDADADAFPGQMWHLDLDGDGYGANGSETYACAQPPQGVLVGGDCDDGDPDAFPGQTWFFDLDGDGYGDDASAITQCARPDHGVLIGGDCDDGDPVLHPAQTWFVDADGDTWGDDGSLVVQCVPPSNGVLRGGDCDDSDPTVHPDAPEVCNGIDDDCNGGVDDDPIDPEPWFVDADGDGWGDDAGDSVEACEPPAGYGPPGDCDDEDSDRHPGAAEVCNGFDDDCDGLVDDEDPALEGAPSWWPDGDGDGDGDPAGEPVDRCEPPEGYVDNADDCDDADPLVQVCEAPIDLEPPSSGKQAMEPPREPSGYGLGCTHSGGSTAPWRVLLLGVLLLGRRRSS